MPETPVAWPVLEDLVEWLGAPSMDAAAQSQLATVLAEVSEWIGWRTGLSLDTAVPQPVKRAVLMYAAKMYRRKDSPDGVAGVGQVGVIRTGRWDSDAEVLLTRWLGIPHA